MTGGGEASRVTTVLRPGELRDPGNTVGNETSVIQPLSLPVRSDGVRQDSNAFHARDPTAKGIVSRGQKSMELTKGPTAGPKSRRMLAPAANEIDQ